MNQLSTPKDILAMLQSMAKDAIMERDGNIALSTTALDAEINYEVLANSVRLHHSLRELQGQLVAQIVRERLWIYYPHEQYPNTYDGLRMFLASTGLGASTVSELSALFYIVPFCDHYKLPIDKYLEGGQWTRTRETIPVLKRGAVDDDVDQAKEVLESLDDVANSDTTTARAALRAKWRKQRGDKPGHGTTYRVPDGRQVVVVAFGQEEDLKKALSRLGPITVWDLQDIGVTTQ